MSRFARTQEDDDYEEDPQAYRPAPHMMFRPSSYVRGAPEDDEEESNAPRARAPRAPKIVQISATGDFNNAGMSLDDRKEKRKHHHHAGEKRLHGGPTHAYHHDDEGDEEERYYKKPTVEPACGCGGHHTPQVRKNPDYPVFKVAAPGQDEQQEEQSAAAAAGRGRGRGLSWAAS